MKQLIFFKSQCLIIASRSRKIPVHISVSSNILIHAHFLHVECNDAMIMTLP